MCSMGWIVDMLVFVVSVGCNGVLDPKELAGNGDIELLCEMANEPRALKAPELGDYPPIGVCLNLVLG